LHSHSCIRRINNELVAQAISLLGIKWSLAFNAPVIESLVRHIIIEYHIGGFTKAQYYTAIQKYPKEEQELLRQFRLTHNKAQKQHLDYLRGILVKVLEVTGSVEREYNFVKQHVFGVMNGQAVLFTHPVLNALYKVPLLKSKEGKHTPFQHPKLPVDTHVVVAGKKLTPVLIEDQTSAEYNEKCVLGNNTHPVQQRVSAFLGMYIDVVFNVYINIAL